MIHLLKIKRGLLALGVAGMFFNLQAQEIQISQIKKHISYLASDQLAGRATGGEGARLAATYIAEQFKEIGLKPPAGQKDYFEVYSFKKSLNPHLTEDPKGSAITGTNVAGYLDNGAVNTIVVGAHYDHLGLTGEGASLDANPAGKIHHGADDNASGTAGVVELARYFVNNKLKEPYNFLFVCFSGEELGLIGSKKFCEHPPVDLAKVDYMVNMDMIGRLNPENRLIVSGVGTSPLWVNLLSYIKTDLKIKTDSSGTGPSDYTSFYLKNIPVVAFFTGQHGDYHKPTDVAEKINYEGEKKVLDYIIQVIEATCTFPKMMFTPTKSPNNESRSFKVTMGVMPDYAFDGKGMRVDGVTEGRPASRAGIKPGDVVLRLGDVEVKDIYSYMDALNHCKKGETVKATVLRGAERVTVDVTF